MDENTTPNLSFAPVVRDDWEALFLLRSLAMQGHIGTLDQVNNERVKQSFFAGMQNDQARHILLDGKPIGFAALRRVDKKLWISHLHIHPDYHAHGFGSIILKDICAEADKAGMPLHVAALKTSPANRFYQRHGFVRTGEDRWDIFYQRPPGGDTVTPENEAAQD